MMAGELLDMVAEKAEKSFDIDKSLFAKYRVKRGLRNADGSGVLVGLSNICDVIGTEKVKDKVIPAEGRLIYRGIDIRDLTSGFQGEGRHGFDETAYLLLTGELPDGETLKQFTGYLASLRDLPETFSRSEMIYGRGSDVMNMLARNILLLYTFDDNAEDTSRKNLLAQCLSLIAKFPAIVVYSYHGMMHNRNRKTLYIRHPDYNLSTAENILYMLKGEGQYTQLDADIIDLCLVLHAEHGGGNNSSFTTRVTSSTGTDTYSAVSSAVSSLKGIYHGGANLKVLDMMENIKQNVSDWTDEGELLQYLIKILRREAHNRTGKLYGIGHAIYTRSDPRAEILKEKAAYLAREKGREAEFALYTLVEKLAPQAFNEYKKEHPKVLCANIDFYSGFVYSCIDIPKEVWTPLFAVSRIAGWSAHRLEELNFTARRIIRPTYRYVGSAQKYVPLGKR
jgi:citrate synthase